MSVCHQIYSFSVPGAKQQAVTFLNALAHIRQFNSSAQVIPGAPMSRLPHVYLVFNSVKIVWLPPVPFGVGEP